jgi:hypothetical protein
VAEYRREAAPTSLPRSLEENVQQGQYINFAGLFSEPALRLPEATPFNFQTAFAGASDILVAKLNAAGSALMSNHLCG